MGFLGFFLGLPEILRVGGQFVYRFLGFLCWKIVFKEFFPWLVF
jgi:hypothetical protein